MGEKVVVGGQAVIEGVMMRWQEKLVIAVRRPNKEIKLLSRKVQPATKRWPLLKLPFLRGSVAFIEALMLGVNALILSANEAMEEEQEELSSWGLALTVAAAMALSIGLFILLPTFLMGFFHNRFQFPLLLNLGEGLFRMTIFLGYVFLVGRWGDMRRVFQYHGAEHKAIYCLEDGKPLTVANARGYMTFHPRCGTSFLLIVMVLSIILFSFFGWPSPLQRALIRLALLPAMAGIAYEAVRLAGRSRNRIVKFLIQPGLWMQRLTTYEPDDSQLEVALSALRTVVAEDIGQKGEPDD